jgi:hypothetical protein
VDQENDICEKCSDGWNLSPDSKSCIKDPIIPVILHCSEPINGKCNKCDTSFHLANDKASCIANITNCDVHDDCKCSVCKDDWHTS